MLLVLDLCTAEGHAISSAAGLIADVTVLGDARLARGTGRHKKAVMLISLSLLESP